MRPVLGRAPLFGVLGVASLVGIVHVGEVSVRRPGQVPDTIAIASAIAVLVAVGVGAAVVHDARSSGMDATDRSMVGWPGALCIGRIIGVAGWMGLVALASSSAAAITLSLSAHGAGHGTGLRDWIGPALPAALQASASVALAAATGAAGATVIRSPQGVMAGFVVLLLVGDPFLADLVPGSEPVLLPDNLLAMASGELEGLAVRASTWRASTVSALVAVAVLTLAAAWVDAARDVGG